MNRGFWEYGVFATGGFAPNYQIAGYFDYEEEFRFFTAGLEAGRFTAKHGRGLLAGRAGWLAEVTPLWINDEPRQTDRLYNYTSARATFPGYKNYGFEFTPLLARWELLHDGLGAAHPWAQAGAGILWTSQNFPQGNSFYHPGETSDVNFLPQVGFGLTLPTHRSQAVDAGVSYLFVTSAGLGSYDPGMSLLKVSLAYKWRR